MDKKQAAAKGENKDVQVIAVGLVVMLFISAGIVYGDRVLARKSAREVDSLNAVIYQKDALIRKLASQLKAAREDLKKIKGDLDDAQVKIGAVKNIVEEAPRQ